MIAVPTGPYGLCGPYGLFSFEDEDDRAQELRESRGEHPGLPQSPRLLVRTVSVDVKQL